MQVNSEQMAVAPPEMMGYVEASSFTGIARATLYAYVSQRRIPFIRYGKRMVRFRRSDLVQWIERHRVAPEPEQSAPDRAAAGSSVASSTTGTSTRRGFATLNKRQSAK